MSINYPKCSLQWCSTAWHHSQFTWQPLWQVNNNCRHTAQHHKLFSFHDTYVLPRHPGMVTCYWCVPTDCSTRLAWTQYAGSIVMITLSHLCAVGGSIQLPFLHIFTTHYNSIIGLGCVHFSVIISATCGLVIQFTHVYGIVSVCACFHVW